MKKNFQQPRLLLLTALFIISLNSFTQKQFTHTATRANNSCNGDCTLLDIAELNNNPDAIILVTPVSDRGANTYPHPIGVYYFKKVWRIFNLDQRSIPEGSKFNVSYVEAPNANYFKYTITQNNIQKDGTALVDHPLLNNRPDAQFTSFLNWNSEIEGGTTNRDPVNFSYNTFAGKWAISNDNKKPLFARVVYNINLSTAGASSMPLVINNAVQINQLTTTANQSNSMEVIHLFMSAWDNKIKVPGDNLIKAHLQQTQLIGFELNAIKPTSGKSRSYELTIKSNMGSVSENYLLNAYVKNAQMEFVFDAYGIDKSTGAEAINYSIKITGARILAYRQHYEENHISTCLSKLHYNEIKISFTQIEVTGRNGYMVVDTF